MPRAYARHTRARFLLSARPSETLGGRIPGFGADEEASRPRFLVIHSARDERSGPLRDVGPETGFEVLRFAPRRSTPSRHAVAGEPVGLAQPLPLSHRNPFPKVVPPYGDTPTWRGVADAPPRPMEVGLYVFLILASDLEHAREQGRNNFSRSWNGFGTCSGLFARFSQKRLSVTEQVVPRICSMILKSCSAPVPLFQELQKVQTTCRS